MYGGKTSETLDEPIAIVYRGFISGWSLVTSIVLFVYISSCIRTLEI